MSLFEGLMLLSFGLAWPVSIYKSWVSRSAEGKSVAFLGVILFGYICGIIHKVLYSQDPVIVLYILNTVMVLTDLILTLKNRYSEKSKEF